MQDVTADSKPLITICIPTYRRSKFMRGCIESCLSQTADNYEIVVHDDTEDDSIKSIVESFASPKIRYTQNKPPLGMIAKLNDFPRWCHGEWMLFLSDDDLIEPTYIESLTRHILRVPDAALIRTRHRLIDDNGEFLRLDMASPVDSSPFAFMAQIYRPDRRSFRTNISVVAFRKSLLLQVGGVKDFKRIWHIDRLAWAEMGSTGTVVCESEPLASIRLHTASITSSVDPNYRLAIEATEQTKEHVERILKRLRSKAKTPEDRAHLDEAEREFKLYLERHLQRAVDQGMLAALDAKDGATVNKEVGDILGTMRRLNIPTFPSLPIYRIAAKLPDWLRPSAVSRIRQAKLARRTRS